MSLFSDSLSVAKCFFCMADTGFRKLSNRNNSWSRKLMQNFGSWTCKDSRLYFGKYFG